MFELKRIVEGILKRPPDEQRLYKVRSMGSRRSRGCRRRWYPGGNVVDVNIGDQPPRGQNSPA